MWEFFRGCRRKIGICLLFLACALMVGWVRSAANVDFIKFPTGRRTWQEWAISDGLIRGWMLNNDLLPRESVPKSIFWQKANSRFEDFAMGDEQRWRWRATRHREGRRVNDAFEFWYIPCSLVIPYWSIVLPVTLLAAVFLPSKPRPSKSKTPAVPNADKAA